MNITELSNSIADELEHRASAEKNKKVKAAEDYFKGYIQACEDFAGQLRRSAREAGQEAAQDAAVSGLMSAT